MGGSASYRYGKKIREAMAAGANADEIADLERRRQEAIAREKARKAERMAKALTETEIVSNYINPVDGRELSENSRITEVKPKSFRNTLINAKESQDANKRWRVDVHDLNDYIEDNDRLFVTRGGSTIAVTPSGDIISVCKNTKDSIFGSELLARAVQMGGVKLDSYEGNHKFYTKNGFEPVSWCEWNEKFKPDDWNENRDKREPIIFYRYVGHPVTETAEAFMARVPASKGINPDTGKYDPDYDYGAAQMVSDKQL